MPTHRDAWACTWRCAWAHQIKLKISLNIIIQENKKNETQNQTSARISADVTPVSSLSSLIAAIRGSSPWSTPPCSKLVNVNTSNKS